jgi:hypothetical protein
VTVEWGWAAGGDFTSNLAGGPGTFHSP